MFAALVLALLSPFAPQETSPPRQVARLELEAPRGRPFVLRACVPIEKGVFPRADGRSPFLVRIGGEGGAMTRAQVEIVSRYPDGEADVVELITPGVLDESIRPGARITCGVFLDDGGESALAPSPPVSERVAALL